MLSVEAIAARMGALRRAERRVLPDITAEEVAERRNAAELAQVQNGEEIKYQVLSELVVPDRFYGKNGLANLKFYATQTDKGWLVKAVYPDRPSEQEPIIFGEAKITASSPEEVHEAGFTWLSNSYPDSSPTWGVSKASESIKDRYVEAFSTLAR